MAAARRVAPPALALSGRPFAAVGLAARSPSRRLVSALTGDDRCRNHGAAAMAPLRGTLRHFICLIEVRGSAPANRSPVTTNARANEERDARKSTEMAD
jgi:hypothetical protein